MKLEELFSILLSFEPSKEIKKREDDIFKLIPELQVCKGFDQHSSWHTYDVYDHTLCVVDGVENDLVLRLAALFHDVGKPLTFTMDESGEGHFYGHFAKSTDIFNQFAAQYNLDPNLTQKVSNLIYYHDLNLTKLKDSKFNKIQSLLTKEDIILLYKLKLSDLMAHSKEYHYLYPTIEEECQRVLKKYE